MASKLVFVVVCGVSISLAVCGGPNAFSQASQGGISGRITDSTGSVVAGAEVVASNLATAVSTKTTSNVDGYYVLSSLPIGDYKVTVTFSGFQIEERSPVAVATAVDTTADFELKPGAVTERVTVQGASPLLEATEIQLSTEVQQAVVMDLPLQLNSSPDASGRRQMDSFIFLAPGVTGNQFSKSFNGSATFEQEIIVDGAIGSGPLTPGLVRGYSPPYEALQEFNVQTSMYPAEYPRGFGVVNYNMKSGTNQLHGDAFEFLRNTNLDARSFFSPTVPVTKQNEYGFTLGGPLLVPKVYDGRGKTFWFFAFTGFKLRSSALGASYVTQPTTPMLNGDFSQLLSLPTPIEIYDPATTRPDGSGGFTRDPFPGNIIPQSRWDPSAAKLIPYIPEANLNQVYNNYLDQTHAPTNDNAISVKLDHTISGRQNVSFTFWWDWTTDLLHSDIAGPLDWRWSTGLPGGGTSASYNFSFTPDLLNTFTVGYMNNGLRRGSYISTIGNSILDIPNAQNWVGFPCFDVPPSVTWGAGCQAPLTESDRGFQIRDTLSWIKGKHSFKFGVDLRHGNSNQSLQGYGGTFNFSNLETSLPDAANPSALGWGFASFLLGQVDNANQLIGSPVLGVRTRFYSYFAQDDFKVTPKLSVQYGLAVDRAVPYWDNHYRMSSVDLTAPNSAAGGIPGALEFAGYGPGRIGGNTFVSPVIELAPRLGVTYAVTNKTLLRAGFGIYYSGGNNNVGQGTEVGSYLTGFAFPQSVASTNSGVTPGMILSRGFPAFTTPLPDLDPTLANGITPDYYNWNSAHSPTVESWTFDVQRQLSLNTVLDAAYVGQQGYHLIGQLENLDQVPTKYLALGAALNEAATPALMQSLGLALPWPGFTGSLAQALRPYPQYLGINDIGQPTGLSNYQGLQVKLQRRLSSGFSLLASYTLSKTIANNGQEGYTTWATSAMDTYHRSLEKTIAPLDQTHVLSISYVYELPVGPGKHFANAPGPVGKLIGGWETTGVLSYASGSPIAVTGGGPIPLFGAGNGPNRNLGVPIRNNISNFDPNNPADLFLNINAFSQPAPYTFGTVTAGTNLPNVRTFPNYNENMALLKNTFITEAKYVQFRVEASNIFNRVVFGPPSSNVNVPGTFGVVSSQANTPRVFQFALKFIF